eukprot:5298196-Amphidinium_carterae.1
MAQGLQSASHWMHRTSTCNYGMPFCAQICLSGFFCAPTLLQDACIPHSGRCPHTHGRRAWHRHRVFPAALWSAIIRT